MMATRTPLPSPLEGEGAERRRREAGEGSLPRTPSPGSLRSPPSPARGEGTERVARAAKTAKSVIRARQLRVRMTDAETKLWFALRDRRFSGVKFRRQVSVRPFIADFVCFEVRAVIEVDGGQHAESKSDRIRDRWFAENGYVVLRFWNNDVLKNLDGVLTSLSETLHQRKGVAR
jgi:very-short-patch-repair endonuclease